MVQTCHRALLTEDILEEVFSRLKSSNEGLSRWNAITLAHAARVCTVWHGPATRSLWWAIPGIEPLLRLLAAFSLLSVIPRPSDHAASRIRDNAYTVDLTGDISPENWESVLKRTAHTRVIHGGYSRYHPSSSVYVLISYMHNGQPLFPLLQELTWHSETADHLGLLLLASPGIRRLTLILGEGETLLSASTLRWQHDFSGTSELDALLQTSLPRLPNLVELKIRAPSTMRLRDHTAWTLIGQLQHLQTLLLGTSCTVATPLVLRDLADLPYLEELELSLYPDANFSHLGVRGFASLKKLTLSVLCYADASCLDIFASPEIHTLSLTYRRTLPAAIPDAINHAAAAFPRLRCLDVRGFIGRMAAPALSTFEDVFGKLVHCVDPEEVTIHTPRGMALSQGGDAELALLAQSWPRLRRLSLVATLVGTTTHDVFLPFAQHCPRLRTLHLRGVDFTGITHERVKATPSAAHGLEEIGVCAASSRNDKRCALFLRRLFPKLKVPDVEWSCPICSLNWADNHSCARTIYSVLRSYRELRSKKGTPGPRSDDLGRSLRMIRSTR